VDKRGGAARVSRALTGELLLKTGKRVPVVLAPVAIGGTSVAVAPPGPPPYTPNPMTDFAASWISTDGVIRLAGFIRFDGAQPGGGNLTQVLTTGNDAGGLAIIDMADPTTAQGAATKNYVDTHALVYDYTVAGADKASIDTGVDAPNSGSNDWTGGHVLEVYIFARTDEAGATVNLDITVNNDTGANYDTQYLQGANVAVGAGTALAANAWSLTPTHGSGGTASYASVLKLEFPGYAGTTFFKTAVLTGARADGTAANESAVLEAIGYRSTSALTRLKVAAQGAAKLKVGTQLLIYKRT
jgi:hypothetical protein